MDIENNKSNTENNLKNNKSEVLSIILFINHKKYLIPESFLYSHPGGYDSIAKKNGLDCTRDFNFHSKKGQHLWENFLVDNENNYIKNNGFDCNIL